MQELYYSVSHAKHAFAQMEDILSALPVVRGAFPDFKSVRSNNIFGETDLAHDFLTLLVDKNDSTAQYVNKVTDGVDIFSYNAKKVHHKIIDTDQGGFSYGSEST